MTDAEKKLWHQLRARQLANYKFRRQHPIGHYIADFACIEYHLIIEADGGQHADNPDDDKRTAWLATQGWEVMRFWNNDILLNPEGVLRMILNRLQNKKPVFVLRRETLTLPSPKGAMGPSLSREAGEGK